MKEKQEQCCTFPMDTSVENCLDGRQPLKTVSDVRSMNARQHASRLLSFGSRPAPLLHRSPGRRWLRLALRSELALEKGSFGIMWPGGFAEPIQLFCLSSTGYLKIESAAAV
jgi:hypothetical protein